MSICVDEEKYFKAVEGGANHIKEWCYINSILSYRVGAEDEDLFVCYVCPRCGMKKKKYWRYAKANFYIYNDQVCAYGGSSNMRDVQPCLY